MQLWAYPKFRMNNTHVLIVFKQRLQASSKAQRLRLDKKEKPTIKFAIVVVIINFISMLYPSTNKHERLNEILYSARSVR